MNTWLGYRNDVTSVVAITYNLFYGKASNRGCQETCSHVQYPYGHLSASTCDAFMPVSDRHEVVARLREDLVAGTQVRFSEQTLSTGCQACDTLLPGAGLRRGTVLEWLSPGCGSGVSWLALAAVKQVLSAGGALVICDRRAMFVPSVLTTLAIDLKRVIVVRAKSDADHAWAIDQALRSTAVTVVWARVARLNDKTSRRLQLAAEQGGAIGLLIRPADIRGQPTWAEAQLLATPLAGHTQRAWRVECVRARGSTEARQPIDLEWHATTGTLQPLSIDHAATHPLSVVSALGSATRS